MHLSLGADPSNLQHLNTDQACRFSFLRSLAHRIIWWLPPAWRERYAEALLRRPQAPAPAMEHVLQYWLSLRKSSRSDRARKGPTVCRGADSFYARQYRQFLNPPMGAFAATAIQVVIASGSAVRGRLWRSCRCTQAALIELPGKVSPIIAIDAQTVALAVLLPKLRRQGEGETLQAWLDGSGPLPGLYHALQQGRKIPALDCVTQARERSVSGSVIAVIDAALHTRRLALLALHPYDPDAMGLHISLFDLQALSPDELIRQHGMDPTALQAHYAAASHADRQLYYLVGATEETFTQCSQNLFSKRPKLSASDDPPIPQQHATWEPRQPLAQLIGTQFELLQVTISASGLPGISPRNGAVGKVGYVIYFGKQPGLLVPYFPGNAVHGHAAKLASNPYGTIILSDDHATLTRVLLSGPCYTVTDAWVQKRFPELCRRNARSNAAGGTAHGSTPEYWFLQEVHEIVRESEALPATELDPARPSCSISAGGEARHNKKPAYFGADSLPEYDMHLLQQRERQGRVIDHSGEKHRQWCKDLQPALQKRRDSLSHLDPMQSQMTARP